RWWAVVVCFVAASGLWTSVSAQISSGALTGTIVDKSGTAVPGATVTVVATGTNASRTVVSAQDGLYSVPQLRPGVYSVRVELSGFRTLNRTGVRIATGETIRLNLELEVGAVAETLTVTADAPLLRGNTTGLGQVIDNQRIVDLPLNGRSFISLA